MRRIGPILAAAALLAGPVAAGQPAPETEEPEAAAPEPRPFLPAPAPLSDLAYDSRIRASMASAQHFQGPLDGSWTLRSGAEPLYALQLADRGAGAVEGAWRDLKRPGVPAASGFIDAIERTPSGLVLRFDGRSALLRAGADGRWSGELATPDGPHPAVLARN